MRKTSQVCSHFAWSGFSSAVRRTSDSTPARHQPVRLTHRPSYALCGQKRSFQAVDRRQAGLSDRPQHVCWEMDSYGLDGKRDTHGRLLCGCRTRRERCFPRHPAASLYAATAPAVHIAVASPPDRMRLRTARMPSYLYKCLAIRQPATKHRATTPARRGVVPGNNHGEHVPCG